LFGLVQLIEDGVVGLSSAALVWENDEETVGAKEFSFPPKAANTQQPWPTSRQD
jgi:hypothetical protein